ncbi:hypothetical protein ACLBW2_11255 [Enterobacteriaceae bacterium C23F]
MTVRPRSLFVLCLSLLAPFAIQDNNACIKDAEKRFELSYKCQF